jgi:ribosomal protein S18 acetylase RimI-like enzyme
VGAYAIRPARHDDVAAVAGLLGELGYPTSPEQARAQLQRLNGRTDAGVLVADGAGAIAGVAAYQLVDLLERAAPQCRVTTLVVGAAHRRRGIAAALLGAIEAIARERGCFRLEVTTHPERAAALAMYQAGGFVKRPHRLVKKL